MSGFSLFALLSLVFIIIFPISIGVKKYWPALLGASLYLPIVFLVSNRKKWAYFSQLNGSIIKSLVFASGLDWELGMAPLSNVGTEKHSFLQEKVAYLIYAFTNRFYSFSGFRQYKQKFSPIWTPRYVAYPRDTWLILDMLAIYRVDNREVKKLSY